MMHNVIMNKKYYMMEPLIINHIEINDSKLKREACGDDAVLLVFVKYFRVSECIQFMVRNSSSDDNEEANKNRDEQIL